MRPLILDIPTIAITGSSGKTTTREIIASILKTKWKILKTRANFNLPLHTKETVSRYDPSVQAIILELGMGKQGAGERHCSHVQPNISIITNIGSAHYGNLGNDIKSTAQFKSALIKHMKPDGMLLINKDDENSKLLDMTTFQGEIITVGITNEADYQMTNVRNLLSGTTFQIRLDGINEVFFIPTFGRHNLYNALFAIALCHRLAFTPDEIRLGLKNYRVPIKRLNFIKLNSQSVLIDDTVNSNPEAVKASVDVLMEQGSDKKKIVVLGSMLELGEYSAEGHREVGKYLAKKEVDRIYTFGSEARLIGSSAVEAGYPADHVHHFQQRENLHRRLKRSIDLNSIILVKGSSLMQMDLTVKYIKSRFMYSVAFHDDSEAGSIYMSSQTLKQLKNESTTITLHFGALSKDFPVTIDDGLELNEIVIPTKLTKRISIPDLPYEYYLEKGHLFLGPVIGLLIYPRYYLDPKQQLLRFSNYDEIKGLIFLFRPNTINRSYKTIKGYYYDPRTKTFKSGSFPYPSAIVNRLPIGEDLYKHFKKHIGNNIFNYPYTNTNKLDFWSQMSKIPVIKDHLPVTKAYKNVTSLLEMLNKYDSAYLKPTSLAGGRGILHVKKLDHGYVVSDKSGDQVTPKSDKELSLVLREKFEPNRNYIVQKEIPYFNEQGNKIDFRAYFQKSYRKRWKYSGIETKVAKIGSIISNSKNREEIMSGETALREIYGLDENKVKDKIKELTSLCLPVLKAMEQNGGHLGDAAVDFVMDQNHHIWLLEVQLNYCAELKAFRKEGEKRILPKILPTPFKYAKTLTGF